MKDRDATTEKRTCSKSAPFVYFLLESSAIVLIIYIVTGGDLLSRFGLILMAMGLLYPALKLPKFLKRVVQCRGYRQLKAKA